MTNSASSLHFPPFRLDLRQQQLWRGTKEIMLRRQTFAVLRYLVEHAGEVVSKDTLLEALWPGVYVTDVAPMLCIRELRQVLGDDTQRPRFIQTIHRRGYRWIGKVVSRQVPVDSKKKKAVKSPKRVTEHWPLATRLVGRETELAHLHQWLAKTAQGERQMVFITGEPGIGKSALVEAFVGQVAQGQGSHSALRTPQSAIVGRGQCIEQYGPGEPYLPVLEALGRLGRGAQGKQLKRILHQSAPTWLVQMPALLSAKELQTLQPRILGATRNRMLRELAQTLEVLTADYPLVLVLEDLQWADASTLDLLAVLARRREPARLLVLATYRPLEVLGTEHPLTRLIPELRAHEQCVEIVLAALSEAEVGQYLDRRCAASVLPTRLAAILHQRTGGNPLFLVSTVNDWIQRGVLSHTEGSWSLHGDLDIVATQIPDSIRQLVSRQRERLLPTEQRILEAGSVAGLEFSVAAVAAALDTVGAEVEEHCLGLAERQRFLRPVGIEEWPDGTVAARYGFLHALYQQLWHERVSVQRQQQWHRRIGECKEAAWGERTREIAAELAVHFEQGREYRRAIRCLQQAGETALQRAASAEAISHLTRALDLLPLLPDTSERVRQELVLHSTLCIPLQMTKGLTAPEVEHTYTRARELCRQVAETPELLRTLTGLGGFHFARGELETARGLGEQCLQLAQRAHAPEFLLQAHALLTSTLFMLGEFSSVGGHAEQVTALYNPQERSSEVTLAGPDLGLVCLSLSRAAQALWFLGYPAQSLQRITEALSLSRTSTHPYNLVWTLVYSAMISHFRREDSLIQAQIEEVIMIAREQGFASASQEGALLGGWARVMQGQRDEGIAQIRQSLAIRQAAGIGLQTYYLTLLVEAYTQGGATQEGLMTLAEGFVNMNKTGQRFFEAEMYRLKGELLRAQDSAVTAVKAGVQHRSSSVGQTAKVLDSGLRRNDKEAEAYFHKAIEVARRQEAKSLELRATVNLSRLWQQQGKQKEAHRMLAKIYGWFTEGFDTVDLQEAGALLEELSPALQAIR